MGHFGEMRDSTARSILKAPDMADVLIALGWPVVPGSNDIEFWQIGIVTFTDAKLPKFAAWADIVPGSD